MRPRKMFAFFALLCLISVVLLTFSKTHEDTEPTDGTSAVESPSTRAPVRESAPVSAAEQQPMAAEPMKRENIKLIVDGITQEANEPLISVNGDGELVMPVSAAKTVFACAIHIYENTRLIIAQNTTRIELMLDETSMKLGDDTVELKAAFTAKDGVFSIPLEALEKGLSYDINWDSKRNTVTMVSKIANRKILPEAYDYRTEGRAPGVGNQGTLGTCWAFASLMALESTLLPETPMDLSEDHMSLNNGFCLSQNDGGEYTMSMAYLLSWRGPVLEEADPYGDGYSPEGLSPIKHVQEIQLLPGKDYEKIKMAVYLQGGVQSSLYTSLQNYKSRSVYYNKENNAYCYVGTEKPNHDSVIIGWDDNYSKDNFNMEVEGDGAFICTNSWGEEFGDSGYFYVSYYDTNIGIHNILYTVVEDHDNYDHIYQTDLRGWVGQLGYGEESAYFANVYETDGPEALKAVGFYATGPDTKYQVYLQRNAATSREFTMEQPVAQGDFKNTGYYTVLLDQSIDLGEKERYAVIVKITTPDSVHPVAIEYDAGDGLTKVDTSDGEGYISTHGISWERVEEKQNCNICLKAYTVDK